MKIAILASRRSPTGPEVTGGLGLSMWEIASGLANRHHEIDLYCQPGEGAHLPNLTALVYPPALLDVDWDQYDVILDGDHQHDLSRLRPDLKVVNRIGDRECTWKPPNMVVASAYMANLYPVARVIRTGIDELKRTIWREEKGYLAYMSGPHAHKGPLTAELVAATAQKPLRRAEDLTGPEKWDFLGGAIALLFPSSIDAAPRLPLEAAIMGTPTLCLNNDGAREHVLEGCTGYVCRDWVEMVDKLGCLTELDWEKGKDWLYREHGYAQMIEQYEEALISVRDGGGWL